MRDARLEVFETNVGLSNIKRGVVYFIDKSGLDAGIQTLIPYLYLAMVWSNRDVALW